jgi:hypothetical protein
MSNKTYDIYRHPTKNEYVAVKSGFSWPALFFSWVWALIKGLWIQAAIFIVAGLVLINAESALRRSGIPPGNPIIPTVWLGLYIWFGISGNDWRRRSLKNKGYKCIRSVQAKLGSDAIDKVINSLN